MKKAFDAIPEHLKPRKEEKGQLFKSGFMEKITRTSIYVPVIMHTVIAISFVFLASSYAGLNWWTIAITFVLGWLTWSLTEYWVHRIVYHIHTKNKLLLKIQHLGHGIHHQYPTDPERLAMPPLPAIALISVFFGVFYLIMGWYAFAFFPGFLIGYMLYIALHYAQHRFKAPKFKPLNRLWKFHAQHHYKFPETKAFGVSTRLWDWVFGTMPD